MVGIRPGEVARGEEAEKHHQGGSMKTNHRPGRRVRILLAATILVVSVPSLASAATLKIFASTLRPYVNNQNSIQIPGAYSALPDSGDPEETRMGFFGALSIPVGSRIKGLRYYHKGLTPPVGTTVELYRRRIDLEAEKIAAADSQDATGAIVRVDGAFVLGADPVVRKGYVYSVVVFSRNNQSRVYGVEVDYQQP